MTKNQYRCVGLGFLAGGFVLFFAYQDKLPSRVAWPLVIGLSAGWLFLSVPVLASALDDYEEQAALRKEILETTCQSFLDWAYENDSVLRSAITQMPRYRRYRSSFRRWHYLTKKYRQETAQVRRALDLESQLARQVREHLSEDAPDHPDNN